MRVIGVIPARYGSSRLPGKPLKDICGKPMIWWVYQNVTKVDGFQDILVATDEERIINTCKNWGIPAVLTKSIHKTAIHRLGEVMNMIDGDYYIQINGDEPLIEPHVIQAVFPTDSILEDIWGENVITAIDNPVEAMDISNIKMVFDHDHICTYMSRIAIPFPNNTIDYQYYKHIGVIGFTKKMIELYSRTEPGNLEKIEGIDLLRFIDYGKKLHLNIVDNCSSLSVDTPKDLEEVRKRIAMRIGIY